MPVKPSRTRTNPSEQKTQISLTCPSPIWWLLHGAQNPIPSRTRPLNPVAPMVLSLKTWESRSPPGPQRTRHLSKTKQQNAPVHIKHGGVCVWAAKCPCGPTSRETPELLWSRQRRRTFRVAATGNPVVQYPEGFRRAARRARRFGSPAFATGEARRCRRSITKPNGCLCSVADRIDQLFDELGHRVAPRAPFGPGRALAAPQLQGFEQNRLVSRKLPQRTLAALGL